MSKKARPDILVLSHLRWSFVFQRPQQLMTRLAANHRVFFLEEPVFESSHCRLDVQKVEPNIWVLVPHLPEGMDEAAVFGTLRELLDSALSKHQILDFILWYYTPMMLPFTRHLAPRAVVFDCMDELSAFKNAPAALLRREEELFMRADVVFTGGFSLYEAKRSRHPNVHPFPSSVDVSHFAKARQTQNEPTDQAPIPFPRIGFFGVIDERMDLELLAGIAHVRPDWHLVFVGPVVKISLDSLPRFPNIHYLGSKKYSELPAYLAGWEAAMIPFAQNQSTRFISPTKTPEYLAAGRPVVSTPIRDVVRPYGDEGLVRIGDSVNSFVAGIEASMKMDKPQWLSRVDAFLANTSWERTLSQMEVLMEAACKQRLRPSVNQRLSHSLGANQLEP